MSDTSSPWHTVPVKRKKWFSWLRHRRSHLAIALCCGVGVITLLLCQWQLQKQQAEMVATQPIDSLSQQYARLLSVPVSRRDDEHTDRLLAVLLSAPHVVRAKVYDLAGNQLSGLPEPSTPVVGAKNHASKEIVTVTPILADESNAQVEGKLKKIGVLVIAVSSDAQFGPLTHLAEQQRWLVFCFAALSMVIGIFITLAVQRYRPLKPYVAHYISQRLRGRHRHHD